MRLLRWVAVATVVLSAASPAIHAQTARSGGAPNAQLLQQLQQLASERTSMQAENTRMKKELEDLRKERDQLKKGQEAVGARVKSSEVALARSNAQRETTEQELAQTKAKTQELIAKFRETIQTLRDVEAEHTTTKQTLATRDQELKTCVDRNLALYQLNGEVLTRLERQGVWSRVAQVEPFTRIKRTQLENLIDEYKSRADDQRTAPATTTSPAHRSASPPGSAHPEGSTSSSGPAPGGQAAPRSDAQ